MSRLFHGAVLAATAMLAASSAPALAVVYTVTFGGNLSDNYVQTNGSVTDTATDGTFSAVFTFDTDDLPLSTPLDGESFRYELPQGLFTANVTITGGIAPAFRGGATSNILSGTFGAEGTLNLEDLGVERDDADFYESAIIAISGSGGLAAVPGRDFPDFESAQGLYFSLSSTFIDRNGGVDRYTYAGGNIETVSAAVPEPATWATMALGFGLLGAAARRQRAAARA